MTDIKITPLAFVKAWARRHPGYTGLVVVEREEPRGKGGWKRKTVTRQVLAYKPDYEKAGRCGWRSNGECECCHRFYAGLELMAVRVVLLTPERRGLIAYGSICGDCRHRFQLPVATPIAVVRLTMEPL